MRALARIALWSLLGLSWFCIMLLPFAETPKDGALTVMFYPWIGHEQRLSAMVDAEVYLTDKPNHLSLSGFVLPGWAGASILRENGAFLISSSDQLPFCRQEEKTADAG